MAGPLGADPLFTPTYRSFPTALAPWSVCIADFNADGRSDLAVAGMGDSVSVLLGRGNGTFEARTDFRVAGSANSVAAADVNADGRLDLALAHYGPDRVSVLLGNGDGTFGPVTAFETGIDPQSATIADLNADGRPDLVTANYNANTVSVLLGRGDGTFQARTDFGTGIIPYDIAAADLNSDGRADLVAVNRIGTVSVLLGLGNGTFAGHKEFGVGEDPRGVAIGDLDADGRPDLAVANLNSSSVSVLLGNGDGTFRAKIDFVAGGRPHAVAIADLNRDGRADLAAATWGPSSVAVLLGNGDGTFRPKSEFSTYGVNLDLAIADLNGDGRPDIAACGSGDSEESYAVSVLEGNGDGTFGARTFSTGYWPYTVAAADLDGDGDADLVTSNAGRPPVNGTVSVLLANGDGTFAPKLDYSIGGAPRMVGVADLNGDGRPDLAAANGSSRGVSVLLGNGDGTFGASRDFSAGNSPSSLAIADLNADGRLDLCVANWDGVYPSFVGTVSILLGNGDGSFGPMRSFATGGNNSSVAIADFNADGRLDLVVTKELANRGSVLLGNGDGTFGSPTDFGTGDRPTQVRVADLNVDTRPDLVVANYFSGTVSVLLGLGGGRFGLGGQFNAGGGFAVSIGDLDGDGRLDLAVPHGSAVSVLLGDGSGGFGEQTVYGCGPWSASAAVSDLDGDGWPDLAVANSTVSTVTVLLNRSGPPPPMAMGFDFTPNTLNLASRGRWVKGLLEPAPPFAAKHIDVSSIRLNGTVPVEPVAPTALGDHDGNGVPDLMVRFDRTSVDLTLSEGDSVPVSVTGIMDGQSFTGTDFIRVRRGRISAPLAGSLLTAGSVAEVRWETPNGVKVGSVALLFSPDGGGTWSPIARGQPNTGSYDWTVPNVQTDQAKVAVVVESADATGDLVDGVLGVSEAFSIEAVVAVADRVPAQLALAIRGPTPNPATGGRLRVEFALRDGSPARLELMDVAGRLLSMRQVGSFGPGTHALDLSEGRALRPGMYFLRLTQGMSEVRARAAVLR